MKRNPTLDEIRGTLSGRTAVPVGRYRYYSVLLPLIRTGDGLSVLFEVRSPNLRIQPGEIALPGGKVEPGEDPADCAVRETCEELGVFPSDITLYGPLNYIVTYSNFTMYGYAGELSADALTRLAPGEDEVAETFLVPLSFFFDNEPEIYTNVVQPHIDPAFPADKVVSQAERVTGGGSKYKWRTGTNDVMIYTWTDPLTGCERVIWGLTARLIYDFTRLFD
jgi:8-oxo-dGTP pyrophosphatase MutT (NUDIX family)